MTNVIGWDLGGANIKLARAEGARVGDGRVMRVAQIPCPIVPERSKFDAAVDAALPFISSPALHAVTMTGELSDVFSDRAKGVVYLVDLMLRVTGGQPLLIYAGSAGFLAPEEAKRRTLEVASANWHATAAFIAWHHADGLLVDVGTTTTDLIPIKGGAVATRGATDAERLTDGELLYTGVIRTPVMAVAHSAPFHGRIQRIAAERFATMADIWRLTGDLSEDADPYPSADQRGKSLAESAARLARMLGSDASDGNDETWTLVARWFAEAQARAICDAASLVLSAERLPSTTTIFAAGIGRVLVDEVARRLHCACVGFDELCDVAPEARTAACRCAPAVALAVLSSS